MSNNKIPYSPKFGDPELKKKIYDHWKGIQIIKEIEGNQPKKLVDQKIRSAILNLLREGLEERDEDDNQIRRRYVFSTKEIHSFIKDSIQVKIKISNVYFHLHKLQDQNLVKIIATKKEGRNITHYYGCTARLFLWLGDPVEKLSETEIFQSIHKLISILNPNLFNNTIEAILTSFAMNKKENHRRIKEWIYKNEQILINNQFDIRDLYKFLILIPNLDPEKIETLKALSTLLKLD